MPRHIIDQTHPPTGASRLRHFLNLQRSQHPARASLTLQRRTRKTGISARTRQFARIERGHLT